MVAILNLISKMSFQILIKAKYLSIAVFRPDVFFFNYYFLALNTGRTQEMSLLLALSHAGMLLNFTSLNLF